MIRIRLCCWPCKLLDDGDFLFVQDLVIRLLWLCSFFSQYVCCFISCNSKWAGIHWRATMYVVLSCCIPLASIGASLLVKAFKGWPCVSEKHYRNDILCWVRNQGHCLHECFCLCFVGAAVFSSSHVVFLSTVLWVNNDDTSSSIYDSSSGWTINIYIFRSMNPEGCLLEA